MNRKYLSGFFSIDALFAVLPVILMLVYALNFAFHLSSHASKNTEQEILYGKLLTLSDYVVRYYAVEKDKEGNYYFPNRMERYSFSESELDSLRSELSLTSLYMGKTPDYSYGICIYRIAVDHYGELIKMYFCGS